MFNYELKKDALETHERAVVWYNDSNIKMRNACDYLHNSREMALGKITAVEVLVSSIANKPKEFDTNMGEIKKHLQQFHQTKEFADKSYKDTLSSGINIAFGVTLGSAIATAAPSVALV